MFKFKLEFGIVEINKRAFAVFFFLVKVNVSLM